LTVTLERGAGLFGVIASAAAHDRPSRAPAASRALFVSALESISAYLTITVYATENW
jgi:hypothetical protein